MSALAAWEIVPSSPRPARPRLELVSTPTTDRRLRLTRRARLVRTAVLAVLAVTVLLVLGGVATSALRPSPAGVPSGTAREVVVQPGQTLSDVAVATLPQLSIPDAVTALQLANDLNSAHVRAGQRLVIPTIG